MLINLCKKMSSISLQQDKMGSTFFLTSKCHTVYQKRESRCCSFIYFELRNSGIKPCQLSYYLVTFGVKVITRCNWLVLFHKKSKRVLTCGLHRPLKIQMCSINAASNEGKFVFIEECFANVFTFMAIRESHKLEKNK